MKSRFSLRRVFSTVAPLAKPPPPPPPSPNPSQLLPPPPTISNPAQTNVFTQISPQIRQTLARHDITEPFPIQTATFGHIRARENMLIRSQTGTGKTMAFMIPLLDRILLSKTEASKRTDIFPKVLVICPTRELAMQVDAQIPIVSKSIRHVCLYGGVSQSHQVVMLEKGVDVVVGTPGRLVDLCQSGNLSLAQLDTVVLDECDRMLDIGFKHEISQLFELLRQHKGGKYEASLVQKLLFSATVPQWVMLLRDEHLGKQSVFVDMCGAEDDDDASETCQNIRHLAIPSLPKTRQEVLIDVLRIYARGKQSLIFVDTQQECDKIANQLVAFDNRSAALHAGLSQDSRVKVMNDFRMGRIETLVATDIASRGIDIPNIGVVIQLGIPAKPEQFVHRSGRTGRMGKAGLCITLYDPFQDFPALTALESLLKISVARVPPPRAEDVLELSVNSVLDRAETMDMDSIKPFIPHAVDILDGMDPVHAVAVLLSLSTNAGQIRNRSSITGEIGKVSFLARFDKQGALGVSGVRKYFMAQQIVSGGKLEVYATKNKREFVIDVSESLSKKLVSTDMVDIRPVTQVPQLFIEAPQPLKTEDPVKIIKKPRTFRHVKN